MKIAMVSEHANPMATLGGHDAGGQNVHVAALAGHLARAGEDITVFTRRDNTTDRIRTTAPEGYVVELVPAGPPTEVPKDELLRHMGEFGCYLEQRWRNERFDIAHSHFWMSGVATAFAGPATGIPVAHTFHALGSVKRRHQGRADTSPPERIGLEAGLCHSVDHIIATCQDEVDELAAMGLDPDRATVIPCGVDVNRFRPDSRVAANSAKRRPYRLLSVGRLVERKGVQDVIRALEHLPDAELLIVGGPTPDSLMLDPDVARLTEVAESAGVFDQVRFTGGVSQAMMPELLCSSDIVVTVPWYEPFGIVPLEAMACGRPIVGSAVGGLLDTIVPGRTGELVPPRDSDTLAETLRRLLDDPIRRAAYGQAGPVRVRDDYRWERVAERTLEVYADISAPVTSGTLS